MHYISERPFYRALLTTLEHLQHGGPNSLARRIALSIYCQCFAYTGEMTNPHMRRCSKHSAHVSMQISPALKNNTFSASDARPLSEESLLRLSELGEVFKRIHLRLMSEGYTMRSERPRGPSSPNASNAIKSNNQ